MESYKLIEPLQRSVNEIKESLYPKTLFRVGNEKSIYGTYEESFKKFSLQSLRDGIRVNELNYFKCSIKELEKIEEAVLSLEKQINLDRKNSIQFHSIFDNIHKTKQEAKKQINNIEAFENIKIVKPTPRNIKSKVTYKWLIDIDKLHNFKRLLIKYNLIEKINFQDFKAIFSEKPITELKNQIVWSNDNATHLIYLIIELMNSKILNKKNKNFSYIQLYQCFVKSKGEMFTEKGKSLKNNIDIDISTDFKVITDKIITELLK